MKLKKHKNKKQNDKTQLSATAPLLFFVFWLSRGFLVLTQKVAKTSRDPRNNQKKNRLSGG